MFPVSDGCWSLPFPPSKIQPVSFPSKASCPSPLSFRPKYLLSVRVCVIRRPPPAVAFSSVVRPSEDSCITLRRVADQMPLYWCPFQRPVCRFAPPSPQPMRLVVLGLGVGGGAKETAPPAMVWSPSTHRQASPRIACLC